LLEFVFGGNMSTNSNTSAPEVKAANKFALTVQATDFIIWAGITRSLFNQHGEQVDSMIEYFSGMSISPVVAKQLQQSLDVLIAKYEKKFGVISEDPQMKVALNNMNAMPFAEADVVKAKKVAKKRVAKR
jgi:hypothetical protein